MPNQYHLSAINKIVETAIPYMFKVFFYFYISILVIFFIGYLYLITALGYFQNSDRVLAFFFALWVVKDWCQQFTNLRGVAAMLDDKKYQKEYGSSHTKGLLRTMAVIAYWFCIAMMIVLGGQLFISMGRDAISGNTTEKQIQAINSNITSLNGTVTQLVEKIDNQNNKLENLTNEIHLLFEQNKLRDTELSQKFDQLIQIMQNNTAR